MRFKLFKSNREIDKSSFKENAASILSRDSGYAGFDSYFKGMSFPMHDMKGKSYSFELTGHTAFSSAKGSPFIDRFDQWYFLAKNYDEYYVLHYMIGSFPGEWDVHRISKDIADNLIKGTDQKWAYEISKADNARIKPCIADHLFLAKKVLPQKSRKGIITNDELTGSLLWRINTELRHMKRIDSAEIKKTKLFWYYVPIDLYSGEFFDFYSGDDGFFYLFTTSGDAENYSSGHTNEIYKMSSETFCSVTQKLDSMESYFIQKHWPNTPDYEIIYDYIIHYNGVKRVDSTPSLSGLAARYSITLENDSVPRNTLVFHRGVDGYIYLFDEAEGYHKTKTVFKMSVDAFNGITEKLDAMLSDCVRKEEISDDGTDILQSLKTCDRIAETSKEKLESIPNSLRFVKNVAHFKGLDIIDFEVSFCIVDLMISSDDKYYFRCVEAEVSSESNGRPWFRAFESFCESKCEPSEVLFENLEVNKTHGVLDLLDKTDLEDCYDFDEYMNNKICWASSTTVMPEMISEAYAHRFSYSAL